MKTTQQDQHDHTGVVQDSPREKDRRPELQDWSQFWPSDADIQGQSDAFMREVLTGLEERPPRERLAGYKSETQGQ